MILAQFVQGLTLAIVAIIAFIVIGLALTIMILFTRKKLVRTAPCEIRINDDDSLTKTVAGGQTLLSALTREGIPVPSPCGGKATCKQCRLQILEGKEEPLETDKRP